MQSTMRHMQLVGHFWDKQPTKVSAQCFKLNEFQCLDNILTGKKCRILGFAPSPYLAQAHGLYLLVSSAQQAGVTKDAKCHNQLPAAYASPSSFQEMLMHTVHSEAPLPHGPPSVYSTLKWKADELSATTLGEGLKWREIVTFIGHPLETWGKRMGRCLKLLVEAAAEAVPGLGTPLLLNVRDAFLALVRQNPDWSCTLPDEADMDDQYWNIPRGEVEDALEWALSLVKKHVCCEHVWFSLGKLDKRLDRVGKACGPYHTVISQEELTRYVKWDIHHNTVLTLGCLLLQQTNIGMAIGGFLSSHAAELWCLWREVHCFKPSVIPEFTSSIPDNMRCKLSLPEYTDPAAPVDIFVDPALSPPKPYFNGSLPLHACDHHGLIAHEESPQVTPNDLSDEGFLPWWSPVDTVWGLLTLNGLCIPILSPAPWDGAPGGRLHNILQHAPRRDKADLRLLFIEVDMPKIALSEALKGWKNWDQLSLLNPPQVHTPALMLSRFKDNCRIFLISIPPSLHQPCRAFCFAFLSALYKMPLKWEHHPPLAPWGTATVSISNAGPSLMRKGTTLSANAPQAEWPTWPPVYAPNARTTLRSHLPALMLDSIFLCLPRAERNQRFLFVKN